MCQVNILLYIKGFGGKVQSKGDGDKMREKILKRLKKITLGKIAFFCLLGIFLVFAFASAGKVYMEHMIVKKALQGNEYAIKILAKYKKPGNLDTSVVYRALEGNKYALQILDIDD